MVAGLNNGKVTNILVSDSSVEGALEIPLDSCAVKPILCSSIGGVIGENEGTASFIESENTLVSSNLDSRKNTCNDKSNAGGVIGTNQGEASDLVSDHNKIFASSRGGSYIFLKGSGSIRARTGYVVGYNSKN